MNKYSLSLLVVIFSTASLYSTKSYAENFYEIVDLGKFENDSNGVFAYGINDNRTIVGFSTIDPNTGFSRGFSFNENNSNLTDLGAINNSEVLVEITNIVDGVETEEIVDVGIDTETSSLIFNVNNNDIAVGFSIRIYGSVNSQESEGIVTETAVGTPFERAIYVDTTNLEFSEIPDFDENEPTNMRASAINGDYVVGTGKFNEPEDDSESLFDRGFIYQISSGELIRVSPETDSEYPNLFLRSISDSGHVVGITGVKQVNIFNQTITFSDAVVTNLSDTNTVTILSLFNGSRDSLWDVNDAGIAVGSANKENELDVIKAISIDINTLEIEELGTLNPNFQYSEAFKINNRNQIVGISQTRSQPSTFSGFIYENGEMKDLNKLIGCDTGWTIHEARSINNDGFITGTGVFNGEAKAFMLRPIADQIAPICEDDSLNVGSGSPSLLSLFSLIALLSLRRRYLNK